jgi:hypothetical protein
MNLFAEKMITESRAELIAPNTNDMSLRELRAARPDIRRGDRQACHPNAA